MTEYRIRNIENNLQIQRKVRSGADKWITISYHGHSLNSLISGLSNLLMKDFTPEGEALSEQLESIRLEFVSSTDRIERIVKEVYE